MDISTGKPIIEITEYALKHLQSLQSQQDDELCLRLGVAQGGCSGMSYTMHFEKPENIYTKDTVLKYEDFTLVCDPKSLLYLHGLSLDYDTQLIGGGFKFSNPNATNTCGCGKSFNT
uniref:Iron-sulfur cluster assembly accessory protein n=1 Tax=Gronococcus sybilensis TaxID=3028029 RepID=A0A9Y1I2I8_9RHOD|nr:Iron-sulfur cluster assembly accessory protein [Gronococcus sybilensis]